MITSLLFIEFSKINFYNNVSIITKNVKILAMKSGYSCYQKVNLIHDVIIYVLLSK